jgi:hypothetical protein
MAKSDGKRTADRLQVGTSAIVKIVDYFDDLHSVDPAVLLAALDQEERYGRSVVKAMDEMLFTVTNIYEGDDTFAGDGSQIFRLEPATKMSLETAISWATKHGYGPVAKDVAVPILEAMKIPEAVEVYFVDKGLHSFNRRDSSIPDATTYIKAPSFILAAIPFDYTEKSSKAFVESLHLTLEPAETDGPTYQAILSRALVLAARKCAYLLEICSNPPNPPAVELELEFMGQAELELEEEAKKA